MSSIETSNESATGSAPPKPGEVRLEAVTVPVSDVDRAKEFCEGLGWQLDIDFEPAEGVRAVQFSFSDPAGNLWQLQEIRERLPGR